MHCKPTVSMFLITSNTNSRNVPFHECTVEEAEEIKKYIQNRRDSQLLLVTDKTNVEMIRLSLEELEHVRGVMARFPLRGATI